MRVLSKVLSYIGIFSPFNGPHFTKKNIDTLPILCFWQADQGSPNFTARGPHELSFSMLRAEEPYTAGQIILLFVS